MGGEMKIDDAKRCIESLIVIAQRCERGVVTETDSRCLRAIAELLFVQQAVDEVRQGGNPDDSIQ